jgi:hypothetical protein
MILIYCTGEQINGNKAKLAIEKENETELVLTTSLKKNEKGSTSSSITSPFSVYKMPKTAKEVTFKKEE